MSEKGRVDAVHVEAGPVAAVDETAAGQLKLLDGDELIELSLKPSLWFIAFVSARFVSVVLVLAGLLAMATRNNGSLLAGYTVSLLVLAGILRILMASVQWASRVYVLTNRRVMRLAGVLNVSISDCQLSRVGGAALQEGGGQRWLGLGTIRITTAGTQPRVIVWEHVARAGDVYAKVMRAIKKSRTR